MSIPYSTYASIPELQQLTEDQEALISQFLGLMSSIWEQSDMTSSRWVGSGSEEFKGEATEFDEHFSLVVSSFQSLASATDDSATTYSGLMRRLDALF